jgi:enoyl-CoA hydratase/carnithine racemase
MSSYEYGDTIASIELDDGKVNALGSAAIAQLDEHLDRAVQDGASALILTGRPGVFSAGFDLAELRSDASVREQLRRSLVDLELRLLDFDCPVVIACTGHAMAAGAALLLSADRRIGLDGPFKLGFNEVALGASISAATVELARYRMPMPWFETLASGETLPPRTAQEAGLLDVVVDSESKLVEEARECADKLGQLSPELFRTMRHAAREPVIERIRLERSRL